MVLRQSGNGWNFASETILEDFVWQHLPSLLECQPLKRQYFSDGDVCDILALTTQKRLVIIELKNVRTATSCRSLRATTKACCD